MNNAFNSISSAVTVLKKGGLLAYPTEAIYGIGCDPFNYDAVQRVFNLKKRPFAKGLILIASEFEQIKDLIQPTEHMETVLASWPGPNTWIFPVTIKTPSWLTGEFNSLAVRVTAHPLCRALCQSFGQPLVSTSANLSTKVPAKHWHNIHSEILAGVDLVIKGETGGQEKCSIIRNAVDLKVIRNN